MKEFPEVASELQELRVLRASQSFSKPTNCRVEDKEVLLIDASEFCAAPPSAESSVSSGHIHRTLAVFHGGDGLPALELEPLSTKDLSLVPLMLVSKAASWLRPHLGFDAVKLELPPTAPEAEDVRGFSAKYAIRLDESNWAGALESRQLKPGVLEALLRMFNGAAIRHLAEAPELFVQTGGDWMAVWRHHRFLGEEERPAFLREAKQVRDLLTSRSGQPIPALTIVASPRRPERYCRIFTTIFGAGAGFVVALILQMAIWVFVDDSLSPSLWPFIPAIVLGVFVSRRFLEPAMLKQQRSPT